MKTVLLVLSIFLGSSYSYCQQEDSPKLVVGIVVDQMVYDYIYRFYDKFSEGGFKRLMNDGTNCRNTSYNYIPTYTGPGHASIYTGTTPSNHGIVANDWFDKDTGKEINCVEDSTVNTVGGSSVYGKFSPVNLKANTVTDQLKLTYPDAKVISMSIKNRGAILPGGHLSDGSYWYDFQSGNFITSSFYMEQLPDWVSKFNSSKKVDNYLNNTWNTYYPIAEYTESGDDNSPYEHLLPGKTAPTFPYDLKKMQASTQKYELFVYTPFANEYLTDFAIASIDSEGLGKDGQTDMLCISYSTPDIIGHAFGPYSKEIEDVYIRLDLEIQKLIMELEKKIGKREFTMFLTADHAVVPVPQQLMDMKLPGGYVFLDQHLPDLRSLLTDRFGADLILAHENLNFYLDHEKMTELELNKDEVVDYIIDQVRYWDGVKRVYNCDDLYFGTTDDEWQDMVRRGYHPDESGDIMYILNPGYLAKSSDTEVSRRGTSHGSAYSYDTHVPLLWYGKNIPDQEVFNEIKITDITPTLSHLLYLQLPNAVTGKPILRILDR